MLMVMNPFLVLQVGIWMIGKLVISYSIAMAFGG